MKKVLTCSLILSSLAGAFGLNEAFAADSGNNSLGLVRSNSGELSNTLNYEYFLSSSLYRR